jgi:hypothetical protein
MRCTSILCDTLREEIFISTTAGNGLPLQPTLPYVELKILKQSCSTKHHIENAKTQR